MSGQELLFGSKLPELLAAARMPPGELPSFGFLVTGGAEQGFWVVSLGERRVRRGTQADHVDVLVEADAAVLMALFGGALDLPRALARGALVVRGDAAALQLLARALVGG